MTTDGFRRPFGELLHYGWFTSDGEVDLAATFGGMVAHAATVATELGMEDLGLDHGGWRLFRPLNPPTNEDTLMLLERYDDIRIWAAGEYAAQTSPLFMQMIVANEDNPHTFQGESHFMADDTPDSPGSLAVDRISVDWVTFDCTKRAALLDLPPLIAELGVGLKQAGFDDISTRFFGMLTSGGPDINLGHLWIETPSPARLGEVLAFRQSAPELADWRNRLNGACGGIRRHTLLTQIA